MASGEPVRMVLLTTVGTTFEARLLAARLGAEGVLWELRGASSLYPVGPVHVLVDAADADVARDVVLSTPEVTAPSDTTGSTWCPPDRPIDLRTPVGLWLVLAAILAMAAVGLVRVVTLPAQPAPPTPSVPAGVVSTG